jgi:hypothetical protein
MPDIGDLLQAAARSARSAPDLVLIQRRARSLRRHQYALRSASVVAAMAIVVPVSLQLSGGDGDRLHQVPVSSPSPTPVVSNATGGPQRTADPGASTQQSLPRQSAAAPPCRGCQPLPGAGQTPRPSSSAQAGTPRPSPSRSAPSGAAAASCHVSSSGLAPNQSRTCQFVATQYGGWRVHQSGGAGTQQIYTNVTVTRDGQTYERPGDTGADCANDVIRPGDLVTATVRQESMGYLVVDVGAGAGYRCGTR